MKAELTDPRGRTYEEDAPFYEVMFWDNAFSCSEYRISEADLDEVLDWVEQNSNNRPYSLWACAPTRDGYLAVRLKGTDPTRLDPYPAWVERNRPSPT